MNICCFSSYAIGCIPNYVKYYTEELRKHFDRVILVTNERPLSSHDNDWAMRSAIDICLVKNEGLDFGMYYKIRSEWGACDEVAFANDSCILFRPIGPTINRLRASGLDYCGITDNREGGYHVQSYFLLVRGKCVDVIRRSFDRIGVLPDADVIRRYEIGMSRRLSRGGWTIGALWPCKRGRGLNRTIHRAKELIDMGMPVIKRKVSGGIHKYIGLMQEAAYYDRAGILIDYLLEIHEVSPRIQPTIPLMSALRCTLTHGPQLNSSELAVHGVVDTPRTLNIGGLGQTHEFHDL